MSANEARSLDDGPAQPEESAAGNARPAAPSGVLDEVRAHLPQALVVTCCAPEGRPADPTVTRVRFTARRVATPGPSRTVVRDEVLPADVPVGLPFALTARFDEITEGDWRTSAEFLRDRPGRRAGRGAPLPAAGRPAWRRVLVPVPPPVVRAGPALLAPVPGLVRGGWVAAVGLGIAVALAWQLLAVPADEWAVLLIASSLALVAGVIGARAWHRILNRHRDGSGGWAVQGFVAIVGFVLPSALVVAGARVGFLLDASAPGLLAGLGLGRLGCWWGGCCVGRPTLARWGILASDRRLLIRRHPTQIGEAAAALLTAVVTGLVLGYGPSLAGAGMVLLGGLATHTALRQLWLPLRAEPRRTRYGHLVVLAISSAVAAASVATALG